MPQEKSLFGDDPVGQETSQFGDQPITVAQPKPPERGFWDSVTDLGRALKEGVEPVMNLVQGGPSPGGGIDPQAAMKAGETAWDIVKGFRDAPSKVWPALTRSGAAMVRGDVPGAAYEGAGAVPFVGQPAQQVAQDFGKGHYATGFGHALNLVAPFVAPEALAAIKNVPESIPIAPTLGSNPVVRAAAQEAISEGVPINAAAVTDNPFIRGSQQVTASTPLGAMVESSERTAQRTGFENWAKRLQKQATPADTTAGAYADWDSISQDPAFSKPVQTGVKPAPQPASSGLVSPSGEPISTAAPGAAAVPVTEDMILPVKIGDLKPQARAFLKDRESWTLAKKQSDPAYALAEWVVNSPDYVPARSAELGLSGLKNRLRQLGSDFSSDTSVTVERGVSSGFIDRLQTAIDRDVEKGSPEAAQSLRAGRSAAAQQAGADWLNQVFSPTEATRGQMPPARGMLRQWERLDPAEKSVMFRNPVMRQSLDHLFGAMDRAEALGSGSRTAPLTAAGASAVGMFTHPVLTLLLNVPPAIIAKLAYNPSFVSAAINGLKIPTGGAATVAAAASASRLMQMVNAATAQAQQPALALP